MRERVTAVGATTSLADRKRRAGQRMVIALGGPAPTDDERRLIAQVQPAGFVLFRRNLVELEQICELNRELCSLVDPGTPPLVMVDQEGGAVHRLPEAATHFPSAAAVGRAAHHTAEVSRAMARELRALGFHVNLAPVCDVRTGHAHAALDTRTFGADAATVAAHARAFVTAHHAEGVITCAKHFPGHGGADGDSHTGLPSDEREAEDLRRHAMTAFAAAVPEGGMVMPAHVRYPAFDEEHPATLSPRVVPRLLRGELGFDSVVLTDDLGMEAIQVAVPEAVRQVTRAAIDLLLWCPVLAADERVVELYGELVRCQEEDRMLQELSIDAVRRLDALRERFLLDRPRRPDLSEVGSMAHRVLARTVADRGAP